MYHAMACGVEEPIGPNPYLVSFDPSTNEFIEDNINITRLNRYSIVFHPDTDEKEAETTIARFLVRARRPAYWICAWNMPIAADPRQQDAPIWLRVMEQTARERTEQGWHFCSQHGETLNSRASLQVATLPANEGDLHGFGPVGYQSLRLRRRIILVLGVETDPCALAHEKLAAAMAFMSINGSFTPNQALLRWLAQTNLELAFPKESSSDLSGVVVLRSKPFTSEDLKNLGVTDVRRGEDAHTVWHYRK